MRKGYERCFVGRWLLAVWLALVGLWVPARSEGATNTLLLAFYHPWYATPEGSAGRWYKWDSFRFPDRYHPERVLTNGLRDIASADYPLIGPYDQGDREVVRWHFRLAKAAGIDGFLCSWWKFRTGGSDWDRWQADLFERVLLPVAKEENFKVGIIDECAHYVQSKDELLWRATNTLPRMAAHAAYLRIRNQPAWFVYQVWDDWLSAEDAAEYVRGSERVCGDVFWMFDKLKARAIAEDPGVEMIVRPEWLAVKEIDCFGTYSYLGHWRDVRPETLRKVYIGFTAQVRKSGKAVLLPVVPGHDNTPVNPEPCVIPRVDGQTLRGFLNAVDAARPEIAVVCSFNEWLETTQIEPGRNWDDPYLYLKILAEWRGKKWVTPPLPRSRPE